MFIFLSLFFIISKNWKNLILAWGVRGIFEFPCTHCSQLASQGFGSYLILLCHHIFYMVRVLLLWLLLVKHLRQFVVRHPGSSPGLPEITAVHVWRSVMLLLCSVVFWFKMKSHRACDIFLRLHWWFGVPWAFRLILVGSHLYNK